MGKGTSSNSVWGFQSSPLARVALEDVREMSIVDCEDVFRVNLTGVSIVIE